MKRKGKKYVYWPHPLDKKKWVKARVLKNGMLRIERTISAKKVPKKRGRNEEEDWQRDRR